MSKTPEARVRDPVVAWAKANGVLHLRLHMGHGTAAGWPDDWYGVRGVSIWHEYKQPGMRPRPLQVCRIKQLREAGFVAEWFDNAEHAIAHIAAELRRVCVCV